MKTNFFLLITALFLTTLGYSQITFYVGMGQQKAEGIVFKKDNQNVSGTVHFPGFEDKKIKVRVADKSEKFAGKDIDSVQIFDENKKVIYTFFYTKTKVYKAKGKETKIAKEGWICKTIEGKVSLYLGGVAYGIKDDKIEGDVIKEGNTKADKIKIRKMKVVSKQVNHYLKRKNEDYPTLVSMSSNGASVGFNTFFREFGVYYFNDNQEIAKKIEEKEYKYDDIEEVVNLYNVKPKSKVKAEVKSDAKEVAKPKATKVTKKKPTKKNK